MRITLHIQHHIVYYDVPQLSLARDDVGTNYLCLLVSEIDWQCKYVAVQTSAQRLAALLIDEVDLRSFFKEPELHTWFEFEDMSEEIQARVSEFDMIPDEYLPDSGFKFEGWVAEDRSMLEHVTRLNNAVVQLSISDRSKDHGIDARALGDILKNYQSVLENSLRKIVNTHNKDKSTEVLVPNNYTIRAFAATPGSLNIHMYSTSDQNIFGESIMELGLKKFDEIISDSNNNETLTVALRTVKGHAVSSLKRILDTVLREDLTLIHRWCTPKDFVISTKVIDNPLASNIMKLLQETSDLGIEQRTFIGHFEKIDVINKTWRIFDINEKKKFRGIASADQLSGLTAKTKNYVVECDEVLTEHTVSEKEDVTYVLQSVKEIGKS